MGLNPMVTRASTSSFTFMVPIWAVKGPEDFDRLFAEQLERLRTPRIHEALDALASIGVLEQGEALELVAAYRFFRRLINGLRMLRGSAQDLVLPALDSAEYLHLARRMGYEPDPEITQQLPELRR